MFPLLSSLFGYGAPPPSNIIWTVPDYSNESQSEAPLALAPILRLSKSELSYLTSLLDLYDLTNLYLVGCPQLWNSIKISVCEARKMTLHRGSGLTFDPRVILHDPFPFLSQFKSLRTLQLYGIADHFNSFHTLPSTLDRLDYVWNSDSKSGADYLRKFEYATAFPHLRSLRLSTSDLGSLSDDIPPPPSWPPTLTVLSLQNVCNAADLILFLSRQGENEIVNSDSMVELSYRPSSLPLLSVLQLIHPSADDQPPDAKLLPPNLIHLQWWCPSVDFMSTCFKDDFFDYDVHDDPNRTADDITAHPLPFLRSVVLFGLTDATIKWITSLPHKLDSISFARDMGSHELNGALTSPSIPPIDADDFLSRLKSLLLWDFDFPGFNPQLEALRFSSLTSLTLGFVNVPAAVSCLPRTLKTLQVVAVNDDFTSCLGELPEGLTSLTLTDESIDIGFLARLPRNLKHLRCGFFDESHIGVQLLMREDASLPTDLPYHLIKPNDSVLVGLPPKLESLFIIGAFQLSEIFATFLPRSLRILHFCDYPNAVKLSGGSSTIASWFTSKQAAAEQADRSLRNFLRNMPAGCQTNLVLSRASSGYISLQELKRYCPRMEPQIDE